jgi:2-ketoarginine methyltransferase
MTDIEESELGAALQPIRYMALAHALNAFIASGLLERLRSAPGTPSELATFLGLHHRRTGALLDYLIAEGYLYLRDGRYCLAAKGEQIGQYWPWYELLVGGYGEALAELPKHLRVGSPYARRDGAAVAQGSCGISRHDALPMTADLISAVPESTDLIVDVGCGDGSYLAELCASMPGIRAIGLEPDASAAQLARAKIAEQGLASRVQIVEGSAEEVPAILSDATGVPVVLAAFVLQELLEQHGADYIAELLTSSRAANANAYWVVVEVDHGPMALADLSSPLALGYYNPYYLIHSITEQRLESDSFWRAIFSRSGYEVVDVSHPVATYDSTDLKTAYLLAPRATPMAG